MQPASRVMRLFPAHAGPKKVALGVAGPLASVWRWCLGSSRGSGVGANLRMMMLVDKTGLPAQAPEPLR